MKYLVNNENYQESVEADSFEVDANENLVFFEKTSTIPIAVYPSGRWSKVAKVSDQDLINNLTAKVAELEGKLKAGESQLTGLIKARYNALEVIAEDIKEIRKAASVKTVHNAVNAHLSKSQ